MYSNLERYVPDRKPPMGAVLNPYLSINQGLVLDTIMWEGGGPTVEDLSGNGNTGVFGGDVVNWTSGKYGSAVAIGASEDRILCAGAAKLFNATSGTIEFLVRPNWNHDDGDTYHYFFDTFGGNNKRFTLLKNRSGSGKFNETLLWTNSVIVGNFLYAWQSGVTYHVALVWGENKLYINGILANDYADSNLGVGANDLYIGDRYTSTPRGLDGTVEWFRVWNRALPASKIALLHREPFCGFRWTSIEQLAAYIAAAPPEIKALFMDLSTQLWTIKHSQGIFTKL